MPRLSGFAPRAACSVALLGIASLIAGSQANNQAKDPQNKGNPVELKLRWEVSDKYAVDYPKLCFDQDGTILAVMGTRFKGLAFSAKTGKLGPELKDASPHSATRIFPIDKGRFAIQANNTQEKAFIVWDAATGKVSRTPPYPVVGAGFPDVHLSPDGRYLTASELTFKDGKIVDGPVKVFEMKTGKALVTSEWFQGRARYTSDSSRVVLVDRNRARWFKLPSGQPDGEWKLDADSARGQVQVLDMSADGGVIMCTGLVQTFGIHLIDGKTGATIHSFPLSKYNANHGYLSPAGDTVVLHRAILSITGPSSQSIEVYDSKGTPLGLVKLPDPMLPNRSTAITAVSWESRAVAAFDPGSKTLLVYDLPGGGGGTAVVTRPKGRDPESSREPIPSDAAVAKAEATIRQVLKDDYAKKAPAELKAFAQKLIKLAGETADDPTSRYVMLRDARDFALGVGDPTVTLQAIEALAKLYQIDGPVEQLAALEKILAASALPATAKVIAEAATTSAQAASDADELDEAVQFSQLAANAARKAKFAAAAIEDADFNLAQAKKSRDAFATIRPALEKVKTTPDDQAANTIVGKYRCFVQNRWDDGLKHLTKGEDAALRAVAELDLKAPRTGVIEDAKVADAWWEYAQSAPADSQWAAQVRTRYWYGRCIPSLTGLNKARAEGRLVVTAGGVEYRPGLLCEFSAKQAAVLKGKKARIDPVIDFSAGEFSDGAKQTDLTLKWTGALVPPRGGRYTLVAQTTNPVRVRVDGKVVIDTTVGTAAKKEAPVVLGERATSVVVEYFAPNIDRNKIKLAWVVPGGTAEESIPAECLFHDKKTEATLGK